MSFTKKVVIVTGASSGIGAAAAIAFAKEGANVVIIGRKIMKLQKVRETCAQNGNEHLLVTADLTNEEDTKRVIDETINKFGKIDVLVNNAGGIAFNGILDDNLLKIYDSMMNTNLRGPVYLTHLAAPHLIKTKGNIVNISSVAGQINPRENPFICYGISKAAMDHFTRTVAAELAQYGVRVNSISPGPVKTDLFNNADIKDTSDSPEGLTPLGRISEPEEIADLIVYLASDKAKAITGSGYVADNGYMLM